MMKMLYRRGSVIGLENPEPWQLAGIIKNDRDALADAPLPFWHHNAFIGMEQYMRGHCVTLTHDQCRWGSSSRSCLTLVRIGPNVARGLLVEPTAGWSHWYKVRYCPVVH